jgi:hypothetical protein
MRLPGSRCFWAAMSMFLAVVMTVRSKQANAASRSSYVNAQFWAVDGGLSGSHPTVRGKFA